uniref:Phosphatidylethanolamine-binding protein 1-like n=1 Tax=Callorhinchus milii TaxID=7868 RepID=A0A4W3GQR7_CALMI|eukprot:gi/632989423/ref/XP_007883640.1/ PREDICTED: phosphatidylethanolamine-binding protein 1-like [Callorhinchus milii]
MAVADVADWDKMSLTDVDEAPAAGLKVKFNGLEITKMGQTLTPTQVKNLPLFINWKGMKPKSLYTLLLVDLDAPSRQNPTAREWFHFMLNDMKGNDLDTGIVQTEFISAMPPQNSGKSNTYLYAKP